MNNKILFSLIYILGVLVSAVAQILLKKSTMIRYKNIIREYLNFKTIFAYTLFFSATLCTLFAYKHIPLSMGPILGTTEYIFIAILSYFILKEKISKRKFIGLMIVIFGVLISTI